MATSTRITRSKGESDGLSLPMRSRSTRRDATSGRNGGTTLSTSGREHQQQMPTQTPHPTQSPEAAPAERTATAPMLPPGLHRPLTPCMPLPASPASSLSSSAPLFQEDGYSSTLEEESEVTFTHGRCNGTSPNQHAERTSTPTPSDYMTQGDPDASPSSSSKTHDINNEFLGTNNFFVPDGSNRGIHQIHNKVFHAGYLEYSNNAYLLELPALENMLNTRKFLMNEMSGQFYTVYGNSYWRMSMKPMLQKAWATGELIDELVATRQAFGYTGLADSTPPLTTGNQPTASTSQQPDDLLPRQPAPKTVQYQPPTFRLTRPTTCLTKNERIQVHHNYISAVSSLEHKKDLINRLKRSDHKPLEKFLLKYMLNSKVNNWAMELKAFNIQFDYIKGSNNILADTLSRLISIDPDTPTMPEEPGYEFGYAIFEEFPQVTTTTYEVNEVIVGTNTEIFKNDPELQNSLQCIENPIAPQKLQRLQQQDTNIKILNCKLPNNRLDTEYYSLDENELLTRKVIDGGHKFHAIYLPSVLIFQVLRTAHDDLGHNGFPRTYAAIKRVFFWKGMKEDIRKHCKTCATCQLHKLENVKFERKIFKPSLQPMDFICMDLIGEFHPPTSRGHRYALTAVCMLTGFTWCVPLKTKIAEEVTKAYMDHIYCNFGGSIKILTDNGTEFKNKLFKEVVSKLGTEFSIHSPPYRPQSNGKIEGFHRFLKTCISKHINYGLEWDELTPMATACYNFFPNCSARESTFFIMFGRDPINKLNMLLHAARCYFHDDNGFPNLEALKNIYQVVAQQLLNSREHYVKKHHNQQ